MPAEFKFTGPLADNRWRHIYEEEFRTAMVRATVHVEGRVAASSPVGVGGHLRAGIRGVVRSPFLGIVGVAGPAASYAPVVEVGRKPGKFPPWGPGSALWLWVKRKLGAKDPDSAAFLVARKIAKKGTKGAFMFQKAEQNEQVRVNRFFTAARKRIERRLSDKR